jgi:thioredoxin-related protein
MRALKLLALILAFLTAPAASPHAGLDLEAPVPKGLDLELVVMEAPGCIYCTIFRRDVLPAYQSSERARDVPIRFLDINDEATQ